MFFIFLNCLLSILLSVMIGFSVVWFEHWLTKVERIGMGIMGGSALLRVPGIYFASQGVATPYDGWASCLFMVGAVVFFSGWMYRKRVHDLANGRAVKIAAEYDRRKRARLADG